MSVQDDAQVLLRAIRDATDGSPTPVVLSEISNLTMDEDRAKAAFRYLASKGWLVTFRLAFAGRLSAAGYDALERANSPTPMPPPHAEPSAGKAGDIFMLKPNWNGIGIDLNEVWRRSTNPLGSARAGLVLLPNDAESFAAHAPQSDGQKLTHIKVRGWATNAGTTPLYPTLVRISRPLRLTPTSAFIVTQGPAGTFSRDYAVSAGARQEVSANFFVRGFVGRRGRPIRIVLKVCDNLGRWHRWVFPSVPVR